MMMMMMMWSCCLALEIICLQAFWIFLVLAITINYKVGTYLMD